MTPPKLTSPGELKRLLAAHAIRPQKRYGQNFLCDENAVRHIVEAVGRPTRALEVGPGAGALTVALAPRVRRLIAVELDPRLLPLLHEVLDPFPNVELVHADVLDVDLEALAGRGAPLTVVGNLPYQITSPLLGRLVRSREAVARAVLMVQREVADKLLSPVGSGAGNRLGVLVQAFARPRRLFEVPRTAFFPRPQVDAAVFELEFLDRPRFHAEPEAFFRAVRAAFHLRRKTIRQALIRAPFLGLSVPEVEAALARAGVEPRRRGETLSLEELDRLAQALFHQSPKASS